jgi:hypothetical protein
MRTASDKVVGEIKIYLLCSIIYFSENRAFCEICGKMLYSRTGHRRQCNMEHSLFTLDH